MFENISPCSRKKGRMFLHFQRFQRFRSAFFSFFATNFHLFFPTMSFQTAFFLACALSVKESRHYILLPITCYYAQYRMRSAILRNHLKFMALMRSKSLSGHELKRKKQGAVTYSTDRENGGSKMFIISLGN